MKIQSRPWAIASGIGIVIQFLLNFGLSSLTNVVLPRFAAQSADQQEFMVMSTGLGLVRLCLCGSVYGLLVGAIYALALPRDEYFTATESAFGGSLSAATASLSAGALGLFVSLMFLTAQLGPQVGEAAQLATLIFTQLFTGVVSVLMSGFVALVLGAAGGGVTLALMRREK